MGLLVVLFLDLPALDYRDHLASVRRLLTKEILLEVEQEHMRRAARAYADEQRVWIPRVLPWSTPRMTAMERAPCVVEREGDHRARPLHPHRGT